MKAIHTEERFEEAIEAEQERFRDALSRFVRTYSFLSLIVPFGDTTLERDYLFGRALLRFVRLANGTREIADPAERQKYIVGRWGPRWANGLKGG